MRFVERAAQVAELLDAGYSNRQIAEVLGVSAPRISQIRARLPTIEPFVGTPEPTMRLRSRRDQLWRLRREALELAAAIRGDLRELNEELEAAEIDRSLGLR
jgi:predicted transcriptional regulator